LPHLYASNFHDIPAKVFKPCSAHLSHLALNKEPFGACMVSL